MNLPLLLVVPWAAIAVAIPLTCTAPSSGAHRLEERPSRSVTFVGTTPCGEAVARRLGLDADAPCELIRWSLTLRSSAGTGQPDTFESVCRYGRPQQGTNDLAPGWRTVERAGPWARGRGTALDPRADVYELSPGAPDSVCWQAISPSVLQLLDPEGRPMLGNAGWSFTLNRTARAEEPATVERPPRASSPSPRFALRQATPEIGEQEAFVGRTPWLDEVRRGAFGVQGDGSKLKWDLTLDRDPQTLAPTTFRIRGTLFRAHEGRGRWRVTRGTSLDPDAEVYELALEAGGPTLSFLHLGDLLFFLDDDRAPRIGNADFGYTLNRAEARGAAPRAPGAR